jgi:hypothetical protein
MINIKHKKVKILHKKVKILHKKSKILNKKVKMIKMRISLLKRVQKIQTITNDIFVASKYIMRCNQKCRN